MFYTAPCEFFGFLCVGECTINRKRGQVKIQTNHRQSLCIYIHRIVWGLSLSVVIVCILWMAFFSGELDWVDHY